MLNGSSCGSIFVIYFCFYFSVTLVYLLSVQVHTNVFVICTSLPQCICYLYKFTPVYLFSVQVHTSVFVICTSSHQCICNLYKFTPLYLLSVQIHVCCTALSCYHYYAMLIHVSLTKIYILMLIILHNYPQRMFGIRLTSLILPYFVPVPNQRT